MKVPQSLRDLMDGAETLIHIEDLSNKQGLLQSINPIVKLVAIVSIIAASLFIFNLTYIAILCVLPIILAISSKLPLRHFLSRTAMMPLFSAIISLPILFLTAGTPIASANLGITTLNITAEGITRFLIFTLRVWFCVASLILLVLSSGFDKMLSLLSTLKVPSVIVQLFSLTYRYFFVSIHEAQSVLIAKEARTYRHKKTLNLQSLKDLGSILATLFIRTYERSERVYLAMKARGFAIERNTKNPLPALRVHDVVFASALIATVVLFALL